MTITLTREEAQQVLDAFLGIGQRAYDAMSGDAFHECSIAVSRLRARLAQPEPEPVALRYEYGTDHGDAVNQIFWHKNLRLEKPDGMVRNVVPLYTTPPQREWQWLTDEEMSEAYNVNYNIYKEHVEYVDFVLIYRAIEAKLKEKNA